MTASLHLQCKRLIVQDEGPGSSAAGEKQEWWLRSWLTSSTASVGAAGAELGLWNFLATSFQVRPGQMHPLMDLSDTERTSAHRLCTPEGNSSLRKQERLIACMSVFVQALGLENTSATRASFLIQVSSSTPVTLTHT